MLNKIQFIGRLVKEVEIKEGANDVKIAKFTLANNEKVKGEDKSQFVNFTAFNQTAEYLGKYAQKGQLFYVEGRVSNTSTEVDGVKKYYTDFLVNSVQSLSPKDKDASEGGNSEAAAPKNKTVKTPVKKVSLQLNEDEEYPEA